MYMWDFNSHSYLDLVQSEVPGDYSNTAELHEAPESPVIEMKRSEKIGSGRV